MIEILNNHCNEETGLLLFDPPTGSGKTHNVLQWIFSNYKSYCIDGKKIFFITNLKKNLPFDELKDNFFIPNKKLQDFDKYVTFLDSNADCLIKKFKDVDDSINTYFKNHRIYYKIKSVVNQINKYENKSDLKDIVSSLKDDLRNKYEPEFRRKIEKYLKENHINRQERIKAIQNEDELKWIGELYPAVYSSKRKVFFLSIDKFYHKNSTLVEPSYSFLENDITKNAVIFIDEFDATKDNILKNIIEKGKKQRIDFIHLFTEIYWALSNNIFPQKFTTHSEKREQLIEKGYSLKLDTIHDILKEKATEIVEHYQLQYSFKTVNSNDENLNQRNLLFHNFQYHSVYRNNKKYIRLNENHIAKTNEIIFEESKPEGNNIVALLNQIKGFINYFSGIIKSIAENYQQLETQNRIKNPQSSEFTFDLALSTVIEEFGIETKYKNFLIDNILSERERPRKKQNGEYELNYDLSVYEQGFRYFDFVDDDLHQSKTKTFIYSFQNTPEKFMLKLAEKAKVIGISATSRIQTVTGNYDIEYFKRQLGNKFIKLSLKEREQLSSLFHKQNEHYDQIKINTKWLSFKENYKKEFTDLFEDEELANDVLGDLLSNNPKVTDYLYTRYLKIGFVFKEFLLKKDIIGFLCLLNKEPKWGDRNLNLRILEKIFSYLIEETTKTKECFISKNNEEIEEYNVRNAYKIINSADFDTKKQSFISKLEDGQKLFILSMYQTMGAGQNLQFIAPDSNDLINVQDSQLLNWNTERKTDFNAIYLDKPTHLIQQINKDLNEEGFIRYLFQLEFLAQAGRISIKQLNHQVTVAFKHLLASFNTTTELEKPNNGFLYQDENIKQHFAKYIIQAIGRICRTNLKSKNIYIYADNDLDKLICDFDVESNVVLNEFKALVKSTNCKTKSIDKNLKTYINLANSTNRKVHSKIQKFVKSDWNWNEKQRKEWESLRKMCLTYPTLSEQEVKEKHLNRFLDLYIELPKSGTQYSYNQQEDYLDIQIDFECKLPIKVSEDSVRLKTLFEIPNLLEYFHQNNWATTFKKGKYFLPPELFNNIYKGALGEQTGKFIFESIYNIQLEGLSLEEYELFDYKIKNTGTYIDFKHWKEETKLNYAEQVNKIRKKLEKVNGEKVFIVNILTSKHRDYIKSSDKKIIEVPYLWDTQKKVINTNLLNELQ